MLPVLGAAAQEVYYLQVTQNQRLLYEIPLTAYGKYTLVNRYTDGENTFVIDEDGAHMEEANCPDGVCVSQGIIGPEEIFPICCLPNLLYLEVIPAGEVPEDFDMEGQDYSGLLDDGAQP